MNNQPWPDIYLPQVDAAFPSLKIGATNGIAEFAPGSSQKMYVCGITPYDSTHLGHAATYLTFDLIHRYMRSASSHVDFVENVTDIDEPLLERAARDSVDWRALAQGQIELFRSDMTALHILPPQFFVGATEVMPLVDQAISAMKSRGFVYAVDNDLYFDISTFLGELPMPIEEALAIFAERGGDPSRPGKKHPLDPVLWWANKNNEPGWESSHGYGRPGWHIECCVISLRYLLGEDFLKGSARPTLIDIQGGGSDLIFPHHFMSAAQAKAMTGTDFARAYVHAGMVGLDGEKMSKSKGNLVFVSRLIADGVDPMAIRCALLSTHYSLDRMWSGSVLTEGESFVGNVRKALSRQEVAPVRPVIDAVISALADDLNSPLALSLIAEWAQASIDHGSVDEAGLMARAIDSLLGLAL